MYMMSREFAKNHYIFLIQNENQAPLSAENRDDVAETRKGSPHGHRHQGAFSFDFLHFPADTIG
jgi:hypothetical protein